jgi:hypothetical protein
MAFLFLIGGYWCAPHPSLLRQHTANKWSRQRGVKERSGSGGVIPSRPVPWGRAELSGRRRLSTAGTRATAGLLAGRCGRPTIASCHAGSRALWCLPLLVMMALLSCIKANSSLVCCWFAHSACLSLPL